MPGPIELSARRRYQRRVQSLLEAIDERRRHQLALAARGVRPAGMRELEAELQRLRDELAAVVAAGSRAVTAREATVPRAAAPPAQAPRRHGAGAVVGAAA